MDALPARVRGDLFPAAGPGLRPAPVAVWLLALLVLGSVRQAGLSPFDTIWAEDGSVFLDQALEEGPLRTIPQAYAGYLHLVPRVLSELAAAVPVARSATVLAVSAAVVTVLCALAVLLATSGHVRSVPLRYLLASLVVLQPAAAIESLNAIALLQFHLLIATFWLALWRPASDRAALAAGAATAVAVLTTPLTMTLAPVLLLRVLVVDAWRDRVVPICFTLAATVQVWAILTQPAPGDPGGSVSQLLGLYAGRVASLAVVGLRIGAFLFARVPVLLGVGCMLVVLAALAIGIVRREARHPLTVLLALGSSVGLFVVSVYARGVGPFMVPPPDGTVATGGSRYVIVPTFLLLSALVLVLDDRPARVPARAWATVRAAAVAVLGLVVLVDFRLLTDRGAGPPWSVEVSDAVVECRSGVAEPELQVSPGDQAAFRLDIPCAELPP